MDADRLARVATHAVDRRRQSHVEGLLDLCVDMLDVSGASIALIGDGQHLGNFAATSVAIAVGGRPAVRRSGRGRASRPIGEPGAVLEPDLACANGDWPASRPRRWLTGSRRRSCSPCMSGRSALGCCACTEPSSRRPRPGDLADALALARVATHLLLELEGDLPPGSLRTTWPTSLDHRAIVHQATGMVAVQLDANVRRRPGAASGLRLVARPVARRRRRRCRGPTTAVR